MHQLGIECIETERFDTRVPMVYIQILQDIQNDMGGSWDYWRKGIAMEMTSYVLSKYAREPRTSSKKDYYHSRAAGLAWQTARYDLGKSAVEKLAGRIDLEGFDAAGVIPTRTASGIYALTGPSGPALLKAEEVLAGGNADRTIESYRAEAAKIRLEDRAALWVNGRMEEMVIQKKFNSGETVDLMPGANLAGWYDVCGQFVSDGKEIGGQTSDIGAMLVCGTKFGVNWELTAKVEVLASSNNRIDPNMLAGPLFGVLRSNTMHGVLTRGVQAGLRYKALEVYVNGQSDDDLQITRPPVGASTIVIRTWQGEPEIIVDDKNEPLLGRDFPLAANPDGRIGIGSSTRKAGHKFRFSELKIRKLIKPPAAPQPL